MDAVDYLAVLRRRWLVVGTAVLVALVVGLVSFPPQSRRTGTATSAADRYRATVTLLQTAPAGSVPLRVLPSLATAPEIFTAAAKKAGGDPGTISSQVAITVDEQVRTVDVTATDRDPGRAIRIADAYSVALVDFLRKRAQSENERKIARLEDLLQHNRAERSAIAGSGATAEDRRNDLDAANAAIRKRITELQLDSATAGSELEVLRRAAAVPEPDRVIGPISGVSGNRWLRLALLVGTGLLIGAAGALGVERFDTRLRGRTAVEDALRLPVVASVPAIRRRRRDRYAPLVSTQPDGGVAEAYRSLRSALALLPSLPVAGVNNLGGTSDGSTASPRDPRVLLFVSSRGGDGKTTSLVNLAAALAESGRSVIVLDCDFRHPEAHLFLGVPKGRGLSDLLAMDDEPVLDAVLRDTAIPGVRLAQAGTSTVRPGALMGRMRRHVQEARGLADTVLIDAPPPLLANDAVDLMPMADSVVVVVRDGRTHRGEVAQLSALLARLRMPCLGALLVGARDPGAAYFLGEAPRRRAARSENSRRNRTGRARPGRHERGAK